MWIPAHLMLTMLALAPSAQASEAGFAIAGPIGALFGMLVGLSAGAAGCKSSLN